MKGLAIKEGGAKKPVRRRDNTVLFGEFLRDDISTVLKAKKKKHVKTNWKRSERVSVIIRNQERKSRHKT